MAEKIEPPLTGATIDFGDIPGSIQSVLKGVVAIALALAMFAGGQKAYNAVANNTPDTVQPVEML